MSHGKNCRGNIHIRYYDKPQNKSHKRGSAIINYPPSSKLILKMNDSASKINKAPTMSSNASTFIVKNPEKIIFVNPRIRKLREKSQMNPSDIPNNTNKSRFNNLKQSFDLRNLLKLRESKLSLLNTNKLGRS
jgi:hypothetical protein